jgi:hydrogenase nickel incorporation protein HypA/HybF
MHEVDMTRALLRSLETWKQGHAPQLPRVGSVHLEVGSFTCVEPDQLQFSWNAAIRDTWLSGARLLIVTVPLLGRCLGCMATYSPQAEQGYRSPCCSHPMEEIIHGRELRIRSVDYDLSTPSP